MEEILAILHEIDLLKEEFGLLPTVTFLMEEILSGLLQLIVGPFDFLDVDLLFLIHLGEPVMHDLLMLRSHCPQRIKEISCPHNLRVHDDFVDQMISMGYKLPLLCSENSINLSLNLLG